MRTKEELMAAKWKNNILLPRDDRNTVRTGKEWNDRYMIYPWEKGRDYSEVKANTSREPRGSAPGAA